MYDKLFLLDFDDIIFLYLYFFHQLFHHLYYYLTLYWFLFEEFWFYLMNFWYERFYEGRFEFTITLALFDVFEWFGLLLLKCELTVTHLLFFDSNEIFPPCFILYDVNTMTIFFLIVHQYNQNSTLKLIRRSISWASGVNWLCDKYDDLLYCLIK